MKECTFLSTEEEKIECFEECPLFKEGEDDACPFNNSLLLKKSKEKAYKFDCLSGEITSISTMEEKFSEEFD